MLERFKKTKTKQNSHNKLFQGGPQSLMEMILEEWEWIGETGFLQYSFFGEISRNSFEKKTCTGVLLKVK